jgi:Crinkler effector protein N-terminal domain
MASSSSLQHEASDESIDTSPTVSNIGNVPSPRGLNAAAAEWTINYFVVGDESASSIKVNPDVTVDVLRELINTKLALVPPRHLTKLKLYRVDIADDVELVNNANQELTTKKQTDVLRSLHTLRSVFQGDPNKEKVQILIQLPLLPGEFLCTSIR